MSIAVEPSDEIQDPQEGRPGRSPAHELIVTLMDGYVRTQLLYVAAELRLADVLAQGPLSAEDLAAAAGADHGVLHRVLRGLAMCGILAEGDGRYSLTDAGRLLGAGVPDSLRGAVLSRGDLYYKAAAGLLEATQRGGAPFRHVYGAEFFEHLAGSPERLLSFQQSMVARSQREAAALLRAYDFSGYHHVVDVGGGFGVMLAAILARYPEVHGTLFDRPEVVGRAQEGLDAAGVAGRCTVTGGMPSRRFRAGETCTFCHASFTTGTMRMPCEFFGRAEPPCTMMPGFSWWRRLSRTARPGSRQPS